MHISQNIHIFFLHLVKVVEEPASFPGLRNEEQFIDTMVFVVTQVTEPYK